MSLNTLKAVSLSLSFLIMTVHVGTPAAAALQRLQVGMEAPDFSLAGPAGASRKFADLKGDRLTAIVFWSTWSRKSEELLIRMQKLHEQYRDKGFSVIAVNADDQRLSAQGVAEVKRVAEKLKLDYPVLLDQGLIAFNDFGVIALPTTVILDHARVVRYELSGYPLQGSEEMVDFLAESFEGKKRPAAVVRHGHQPIKSALRAFSMGNNSLKSQRTADSAEIWFKKAVETDPDFILPRIALGKLYARQGNVALARKEFDQALAREPGNVMALCEVGMLMANNGKTEEARTFIDKALSLDDSYHECFSYAGFIYGRLGNMERALQLFDEAAALNPRDYNVLVYKARILEENSRQQDALYAYRQALELILQQR